MIMNKKISILAILATVIGLAASCSKENLEPTLIEKDWSKSIDLSNSYVKQLFEQTGVAILTEYDDTLDVMYQGADYGVIQGIEITHIKAEQKAQAIEWLKTNILDCFSTECIKKYFPRKIFLCDRLVIGQSPSFTPAYMHEVRWASNNWSTLEGIQHAFPFAQGMAICVTVDVLFNPDSQVDYNTQFRQDIMHILCCELFMSHNWLDAIRNDDDLFPDDVTSLYGLNVLDGRTYNSVDQTYYNSAKGMYRLKFGYSAKDSRYGDPITKCDWTKMTLQNYFKFGFPDNPTNSLPNAYNGADIVWPTGTTKTASSRYNDEGVSKTYEYDGYVTIASSNQLAGSSYPCGPYGMYQDARFLIAALTSVNETKLSVYGDLVIHRLWSMSEYLRTEYGIDFRKFDPNVNTLYQMHNN